MTPVTGTAAALVSTALAVGLVSGPPARAEGAADQISGVVGALTGHPGDDSRQTTRDRSDFGRTSAPDGRLRRGCHNYPYRYRLTPPSDDWILETFLRDPTRESIASGIFSSDSDPRTHRTRFRFCRYNTRPGRFKIRALLTWYGPTGDQHQVWLEPSWFRLRRPR